MTKPFTAIALNWRERLVMMADTAVYPITKAWLAEEEVEPDDPRWDYLQPHDVICIVAGKDDSWFTIPVRGEFEPVALQ